METNIVKSHTAWECTTHQTLSGPLAFAYLGLFPIYSPSLRMHEIGGLKILLSRQECFHICIVWEAAAYCIRVAKCTCKCKLFIFLTCCSVCVKSRSAMPGVGNPPLYEQHWCFRTSSFLAVSMKTAWQSPISQLSALAAVHMCREKVAPVSYPPAGFGGQDAIGVVCFSFRLQLMFKHFLKNYTCNCGVNCNMETL